MQEEDRPGRRIAAARKSLGLTQQQLADRAGVSKSLLSKVEAGHAVASTTLVGAAARALGVEPGYLTGQPYSQGPGDLTEVHQTVPAIRRTVATLDLIEETDQVRPLPLEDLRASVATLSRLRRDTAYALVGQALPGLLADLVIATQHYQGDERYEAYGLLAIALRGANALAHKLGYHDLSLSALEHMQMAAQNSQDPLLVAVAEYLRAQGLARIGAHKQGYQLLRRIMDRLEPDLSTGDETMFAIFGALHMQAGVLIAVTGDEDASQAHLFDAAGIAERLGRDKLYYETTFGPTNVKLHRLHAELALGNPREAVKLAEDTRVPDGMAKERASYFHIDSARAFLMNGDLGRALEELYEARALTPVHVRNSAVVRDTLYAIAERQQRSSPGVREFANWAGIRD